MVFVSCELGCELQKKYTITIPGINLCLGNLGLSFNSVISIAESMITFPQLKNDTQQVVKPLPCRCGLSLGIMDSPRDTQTQSEGQVAATSLVSGISSKKEDTPKKGYPQTVKKGNSTAKFMKAVKVETLASAPPSTPPIRTSQRQIKRPKTDDELIDFESSSRGSTSKKIKTSLSSSATPKNPTTVSIYSVTLIRNVSYSRYFKRGLILVNLAIFSMFGKI